MHGSDGVTSPLQFGIAQSGGLSAFDCSALDVGELNQLMIWLEPALVRFHPVLFLCIKDGNEIINDYTFKQYGIVSEVHLHTKMPSKGPSHLHCRRHHTSESKCICTVSKDFCKTFVWHKHMIAKSELHSHRF